MILESILIRQISNGLFFWITRFYPETLHPVFGKMSGESSSDPVGVSENRLEHFWRNLCKNYADCENLY